MPFAIGQCREAIIRRVDESASDRFMRSSIHHNTANSILPGVRRFVLPESPLRAETPSRQQNNQNERSTLTHGVNAVHRSSTSLLLSISLCAPSSLASQPPRSVGTNLTSFRLVPSINPVAC